MRKIQHPNLLLVSRQLHKVNFPFSLFLSFINI